MDFEDILDQCFNKLSRTSNHKFALCSFEYKEGDKCIIPERNIDESLK